MVLEESAECARRINRSISDPKSHLRIVFNHSGLPPPFELSTIESIYNLTPEQVQKCLEYYGYGDSFSSNLRNLLEAVGVDTNKLIDTKNEVARNVNSVVTENQELILLMNEEGRYPEQGIMRNGVKVIELSTLQSSNNRNLRSLFRFYGLSFDDSNFDLRLKIFLEWLGYRINEERLANLEGATVRLENGVGRLENGVGRLENGVGRLENGVGRLENGVGRLETEVRNGFRKVIAQMENVNTQTKNVNTQMKTILSRMDSLEHAIYASIERDREIDNFIQSQINVRKDGE